MNGFRAQTELLKTISHPTRLAVLDLLRDGEQCVCHMEAMLNLRQAYISQHLMLLRQAGLVGHRRVGLNLYYRVVKPDIFSVLDAVNIASGRPANRTAHIHAHTRCPCPKCSAKQSSSLHPAVARS
jgi:DNA-binding transcriptional ArsR family regulator